MAQRELPHQAALLCTLTMTDNVNSKGVARYPVGPCPILDPQTGKVLIDSQGRRSYTTSIAFGPSIGKNIALGYIPHEHAEVGKNLLIEYFHEQYPVRIEAVGYGALYDPENLKAKS